MNILITNDDGIHALGIKTLYNYLKNEHSVTIVAPESQRSGVSHSLSLTKPLRLTQLEKNIFVSDGTPADCVDLGIFHILKDNRPDLIISGINEGPNLGEDVFYSGTVGAILEAKMHNTSGLAVSIISDENNYYNYDKAAETTIEIINKHFKNKNDFLTLNLNLPPLKKNENISGIKYTFLDSRSYPGNVEVRKDPMNKNYFWLGGTKPSWLNKPGSDFHSIKKKFASVTPLCLDISCMQTLKTLNN